MKKNHMGRARDSSILILVKCHICKSNIMMHKNSFCWRHKLCSDCANREVKLYEDVDLLTYERRAYQN